MNTYAAQAVLSSLKGSEESAAQLPPLHDEKKEATHSAFGLTAFVSMTREERMHTFERVMGGRKLLCQVSDLIDVDWPRFKRAGRDIDT